MVTRFEAVGRRAFISQMGKGVFGIAVLGATLAACGDDDPATTSAATAGAASTPGPTGATTGAPTTSVPQTSTTGVSTTPAPPTSGVSVERVILGSVSAYILVRGTAATIVDTGNPGSESAIAEALSTVGLAWTDVGHVILTHLHPDHIGSVGAVMDAAGEAIGYAGAEDIPRISAPRQLTPVATGDSVFGLDIISTPGHTPGHVSVFDPASRALITGDAINGAGSGMPAADESGVAGPNPRFTPDMAQADRSAQTLAALNPESIFFGHGEPLLANAAAALNALTQG